MNEKILMNELLDFYGGLLTEKQQEICRYYYREDLSYQEIADITEVSRAAVYDVIKRCREEMHHYEDILMSREMSQKRIKIYKKIEKLTSDSEILELIAQCSNTENEGGNYE